VETLRNTGLIYRTTAWAYRFRDKNSANLFYLLAPLALKCLQVARR
jgi:hypothetical protein